MHSFLAGCHPSIVHPFIHPSLFSLGAGRSLRYLSETAGDRDRRQWPTHLPVASTAGSFICCLSSTSLRGCCAFAVKSAATSVASLSGKPAFFNCHYLLVISSPHPPLSFVMLPLGLLPGVGTSNIAIHQGKDLGSVVLAVVVVTENTRFW